MKEEKQASESPFGAQRQLPFERSSVVFFFLLSVRLLSFLPELRLSAAVRPWHVECPREAIEALEALQARPLNRSSLKPPTFGKCGLEPACPTELFSQRLHVFTFSGRIGQDVPKPKTKRGSAACKHQPGSGSREGLCGCFLGCLTFLHGVSRQLQAPCEIERAPKALKHWHSPMRWPERMRQPIHVLGCWK